MCPPNSLCSAGGAEQGGDSCPQQGQPLGPLACLHTCLSGNTDSQWVPSAIGGGTSLGRHRERADRNIWVPGGPVAPALRYRGTPVLLPSAPSRARTQREGWSPVLSPTPHPCLLSRLSPTFTTTFLERDMAPSPPAESRREVGTRHPSSTARQPSPSSPPPWETTWPLASSPAVLGSLGRVTAITALGAGLKIRRARRAAGHGGAGGTQGHPGPRDLRLPLPAGDGDRAG